MPEKARGEMVSEIDSSECEREPIHLPGSIQPIGVLIALDEPALHVQQISANAGEWLGVEPAAALDRRLEQVLGTGPAESVRNASRGTQLDDSPVYLGTITASARSFQMVAHRRNGVLIVELEPVISELAVTFRSIYSLVGSFLGRLKQQETVKAVAAIAAAEVRRLTGFDRVLIYRFDPDWNGAVIAEDRNGVLPSYLGLHFPAGDIPPQARDLYRINHLRQIADANSLPVPLVGRSGAPALDLTYANMRTVSPRHIEYMKNMGTISSMSISILRDGELWGLVACHSAAASTISFETRAACEFVGQLLSVAIASAEQHQNALQRVRVKTYESRLLSHVACAGNLAEALASDEEDVLACTQAAGAALVRNGECTLLGRTPEARDVLQLAKWLYTERASDAVFKTDEMHQVFSAAKAYERIASGVLAISLSRVQPSYLIWFRPEVAQTVDWAGELSQAQLEGRAGAINPQRSFGVWQQEVRGRSLPWDPIEIETASSLRFGILNFVLRIAEERAELSTGLERLQARLKVLDKSKSEFLNLISHELRTPLNGLLGVGELLLSDLKEGPEEKEFRDMFEVSRRRILAIVDDALLLAQIEVEAEKFASKPIPLQSVLGAALDQTAGFAGSSHVRFELDQGDPGFVLAEESLLVKAIQAMLETAVKLSRSGDAVHLISRSTGETIHLVIETGGNPIPAAALSRFFDLFSIGQPITMRGDDLGLGAPVAYRIVLLFGGSISVENRKPSGVRMTISLKSVSGAGSPGSVAETAPSLPSSRQ